MSDDEKDKKMDIVVQKILEKGKYDTLTISDVLFSVFGETIPPVIKREIIVRIRIDIVVQKILEKGKYDAWTISDIIDDVFGETIYRDDDVFGRDISYDIEREVLARIREEFRKRCRAKSPS